MTSRAADLAQRAVPKVRKTRDARRLGPLVLLLVCLSAQPRIAPAAEVASNGAGGGDWSDPATWRNKALPGSADDVVIAKGDAVVFDRNDDEKITCNKLYLDPNSVLHWKTGAGKIILTISDALESYGTLKLDGTKSADDLLELRMVGSTPEKRSAKFIKGSGLVVIGRANLPDGRHNVALTSRPKIDEKKETPKASLELGTGTMLELQRADVVNLLIAPSGIDNTGAKPNERINIIDNRFTGLAGINCTSCDTPVIAGNTFEQVGPLFPQAIYINGCSLADIRGNNVLGGFSYGIMGYGQIDATITQNVIAKCSVGIYWSGTNTMIKQFTARDCSTGIIMTSASGALEDIETEGCQTAYYHAGATVQLTGLVVRKLPKDGVPILFASGPLMLLNCGLEPGQIKLGGALPKTEKPEDLVTAMEYLIVGAKGAPEGAQAEVKTSNPVPPLAPGAADLNVRNAPAAITAGLTPLPQSLAPIVVRSWVLDHAFKPQPAPDYIVSILAPAEKPGAARKVLGSMTVKPQSAWFRAKPNDPVATLEVPLK
jgi:hypothetical protein